MWKSEGGEVEEATAVKPEMLLRAELGPGHRPLKGVAWAPRMLFLPLSS